MDIIAVISTLSLVALAELGDKTQLATVTLSARRSPISVFLGAMLAFAVVDGVSALLGGAISTYLPMSWILIGSGLVFILFGLHGLIGAKKEEDVEVKDRGFPLLTSFSLVALMELGDKTQFAVVALASQYDPVMVFLGMMLAFVLITGVGVVLGATLVKRLSTKYLRLGSSALFLLFGAAFLISAVLGTSIF